MKKAVKAQIDWITLEDGGRRNILPVGMRYCPIIIFESNQSDNTLWSAEIYNTSIDGNRSIADVPYFPPDTLDAYLISVTTPSGEKCIHS